MKKTILSCLLAALIAWGILPVTAQAATEDPVVQSSHFHAFEYYDYRTMEEERCSWYYYNKQGHCVREILANKPVETYIEYLLYADGTPKTARQYEDGKLVRITQYDRMGNLRSVSDGQGKLLIRCSNHYDDRGRLLEHKEEETEKYGSLTTEIYTYLEDGGYTHDHTDAIKGNTKPEVRFHDVYTYNANGKLVSHLQDVEYGQPMKNSIVNSYDHKGNIQESVSFYQAYGSEITSVQTVLYKNYYDSRDCLSLAEKTLYSQQNGSDGKVREASSSAYKIQYTYDNNGRLIREETFLENGEVLTYQHWEYDDYGNMVFHTRDGSIVEENEFVPLSYVLWEE